MSFCKRFKIRKTIYPGKALVGYQCPHTFSHSELLKSFSWTIIQPIFLQLLYTWQLLLILDDIAFQCRVHCTLQSKGCGEYILINSKPNFVFTMMVAYSSCKMLIIQMFFIAISQDTLQVSSVRSAKQDSGSKYLLTSLEEWWAFNSRLHHRVGIWLHSVLHTSTRLVRVLSK